jgi:tRNA (adenine57-N1/adenine58-N1)-methyltransferase
MSMDVVQIGDTILFYRLNGGKKIISTIDGNFQKIDGVGVIDSSKIVGIGYGSLFKFGNEMYYILRPILSDYINNIERRAQIITFKDSSRIVSELSIHNGCRVLECGGGNGALTIMLAYHAGDNGHVYTFEVNKLQIEILRKNIDMAMLGKRITILERDCYDKIEIEQESIDACVIDLPEPWKVLPNMMNILKNDGTICSYIPTFNQLEKTYLWLLDNGFINIRALEILEREIHLEKNIIRPEFSMLGFTGYMIFARKIRMD